ncbi:hypothetical protein [Tichowtungia aerotolerans]|uniref:Glycosyl hydrolase family 32 n=1 Tax=Tichowtungia aerotolerans TaxID=2697043 RepID=A0A6P1M8I8_9BACT|nr:hypothetical protein [Tichowtungia aerotolerans]QHI70352.1 hypothetical protein GT409_13185 [Tichowtungia aerotolerans]
MVKKAVLFRGASLLCLTLAGWICSAPISGPGAKVESLSGATVEMFVPGVEIFSNRRFTLAECPDFLNGIPFFQEDINTSSFRVLKDGVITVLTPESDHFKSAQFQALETSGFTRVEEPPLFQLFGDSPANKVRIYQKSVKAGADYTFGKWVVVLGFEDEQIAQINAKKTALADALKSAASGPGAGLELTGGYEADCVDVFTPGVKLFSNRDFVLNECPESLAGQLFLRGNINGDKFNVVRDGTLTVLTPESDQFSSAQGGALMQEGFQRVAEPQLFQLFGDLSANKVGIYSKKVTAGEQYAFGKWTIVLGFAVAEPWKPKPWNENEGEVLYNGIQLPEVWPPEHIDPRSKKPMPVPYLDYPPEVIPIDVGRQLLVDDFLIEKTDLQRTFHYPEKYEGNPVLKPENDLEDGAGSGWAGATPKSGGLWWDPDAQLFKLWYEAGWLGTICYATSKDGIHWDRPETDVLSGYNQVLPFGLKPDSWTVVRDWWTKDPDAKYKIFVRGPGGKPEGAMCFESPDGIHFGDYTMSGVMGDRSTMFYNPFRKKWVYSLRSSFRGRSRHYWEADDFIDGCKWPDFDLKGASWEKGQPVIWAASDELDPEDVEVKQGTQLYNLDAVAYESIMLGFYQIWRGPHNHQCFGVPKITELNFAYSRDGFHWARPDRNTAIESSREAGTWDRGYVQSLGNICVLRGDKIWFYYSGFAGDESRPKGGMYANSAMGLATLRRDGFASMDTRLSGELLTRPVTFSGKYLFVNADVPDGSLQADVLDQNGNVVAETVAFTGDSTIQMMSLSNGSDLSALEGQPVRFRFKLDNGALYSFWVSKDESGRSDGYVAGGGPGYDGGIDTVGAAALSAEKEFSNR